MNTEVDVERVDQSQALSREMVSTAWAVVDGDRCGR